MAENPAPRRSENPVPVETTDDVWRMDAAAFDPQPTGYVKVDGVEHPIYSFLDIPTGESVKVIRAADGLDALGFEERLAKSIEIILALHAGPHPERPATLTDAILRKLAPKQVVTLTVMAMSVAAVPLEADGGAPRESVPSAPASAASTAGLTERSSA